MTDKSIVVTSVAGGISVNDLLASSGSVWLERRSGDMSYNKIPMIIKPRYLTDPHLHDHLMNGGMTKGFPMASFVTRDLGLPSINHKGRVTFPEVFHDFEYISNMPYERFFRNLMKVIPLSGTYGAKFEMDGRVYTIGYPMPSNNLFGFDHRPDQAMSAIDIRDGAIVVSGYEVPGLNRWRWVEMPSGIKAMIYGDYLDWRKGSLEAEYQGLVAKEVLEKNKNWVFPKGMPDGGLRRGQMSMTSACRTGRK